ncbi:MAG: type II toxin-antitoxin system PemK/MazF family toxin [Gemmatimonadaceae bacterium]|nr:type II toxin-antitoxin system PemK/MazF family toxin [Gemmatimonadaceae bacterium]
MKRGDIIKAISAKEYGKPRPSLVVQANSFEGLKSVVICPLTSDLLESSDIRLRIEPNARNGLRLPSNIMIDKVSTIPRARCREVIGKVDELTLERVAANLSLLLGLGD